MDQQYDGEVIQYKVISEHGVKYQKQLYWDLAFGLQKVDNLTPSKYMKELVNKSITGEINNHELEEKLQKYYETQDIKKIEIRNEKECDLVSARIVELLEKDEFEFSVNFIKNIHEYLFNNIYEFNGEFRNVDIIKNEPILNGDTVVYGSYKTIKESLEYDLSIEKDKEYSNMNIVDVINSITDFSSSIWQVHPFREGNTRTTVVFMIKYLRSLNYNVDNDLFKEKSIYFRNALVRSCYFNNYLNIEQDKNYLIRFYENLMLNKNNNLQSKDIVIKELFD